MRCDFKLKKECVIFSAVVLLVMLITSASAGIYFSQIEQSYNIGDVVDLNLTVDPVSDGPLKVNLVCDGNTKDIFNGPAITNIRIPLNSLWIGDLNGNCYFSGEYSGETKSSNQFKISKELIVSLSVDSFFPKPKESITITGTVKKINNQGTNGEVEIVLPFSLTSLQTDSFSNETNLSAIQETASDNRVLYGQVNNGEFSVSFAVPDKINAGDYKLDINAYEKNSDGEKTNQGSASANIKIAQVLTSVDFALNNQNFNPGESISIKPLLLDQAGLSIKDQASVIITDEKLNRVFEKVVQGDEIATYNVLTNQKSGYYLIRVSSGDLNASKSFFLNEKAIASFELRNSTLVIKNIGNIRYKKDVQIELNGKPFVKKVDLDLGESKELKLTGTDGTYDLKISDGTTEFTQGGVFLTGKAIAVTDAKGNISIENVNPFIWAFLIIVLLGGMVFFFINVYKKKSVAYFVGKSDLDKKKALKLDGIVKTKKEENHEAKNKLIPEKHVQKPNLIVPKKISSITEAELGMVVNGQRSRAAILALKLKNKISRDSKINLENALDPVYEKNGCIYEQGEFIIAIFSTLVTHSARNEVEACKIAQKIVASLTEDNKKFKEKIEFGIGINSAEILNEIRNEKLMFTALGNSVSLAKKLSEISKEQVLISKEVYERGISEIKADKKFVGDMEVFEIKKIVDYDRNKKFIDDFVKRNEKDKTRGFSSFNQQNSRSSQPTQFKPLPTQKPDSGKPGFAGSILDDSMKNPARDNINNNNRHL